MLRITHMAQAAHIIRSGGIVAFPTETVYGLGANAFDGRAVKKIFKAKGRPSDNPLIVHIASMRQLKQVTCGNPQNTMSLIKKFWPGPLTLVMKKSKKIPHIVTAGLQTVAVRMPDHPVALRFIKASRVPIAAPSANISGKPSATNAKHVMHDFEGRIDAVIDGGQAKHGVESTVLDLTVHPAAILRPGAITKEQIERVIGSVTFARTGSVVKSPGMKYRHYAPLAKVVLCASLQEIQKRRRKKSAVIAGKKVAGVSFVFINERHLAKNLYHWFREADKKGCGSIFVQTVSENGLGATIMNRLRKAASFK
ncbi:threonylcarbamoyl-AMP synthase [Candidatus Woesearchaeota archaeon]|nr:threonylcarbamoyl-AMP synthase [Candidatus Woesearchaeota archaeon]